MFINFTVDEIIDLHDDILEESKGLDGIKDYNALESSLNNCMTTFFGDELYPSKEDKISNIFYLLIKNHCFNDANKRTAVACFSNLIDDNDININYEFQELENLALDVAENKLAMVDIKDWIKNHKI